MTSNTAESADTTYGGAASNAVLLFDCGTATRLYFSITTTAGLARQMFVGTDGSVGHVNAGLGGSASFTA